MDIIGFVTVKALKHSWDGGQVYEIVDLLLEKIRGVRSLSAEEEVL